MSELSMWRRRDVTSPPREGSARCASVRECPLSPDPVVCLFRLLLAFPVAAAVSVG